jgi:hypothetical protein
VVVFDREEQANATGLKAQFQALRNFALDRPTDHPSHDAQSRMIAATSPAGTATPTTAHYVNL